MRLITTLSIGSLLFGCADTAEEENGESAIHLLSPRGQLLRLSTDLRGVHPSEEELQAIESNPDLYDEYVDRYLDDPRFLERIRQIFNQRYLTRTGGTYGYMADGYSNADVAQAIDDEALRLLSYIVENDLPFTEIVTADYTMANPVLATIWDLEYPEGEAGWRPAYYQDSRPHAGVLSMNSVWHRYPSMGGNANRHRANAVSRMLLCDDSSLTHP